MARVSTHHCHEEFTSNGTAYKVYIFSSSLHDESTLRWKCIYAPTPSGSTPAGSAAWVQQRKMQVGALGYPLITLAYVNRYVHPWKCWLFSCTHTSAATLLRAPSRWISPRFPACRAVAPTFSSRLSWCVLKIDNERAHSESWAEFSRVVSTALLHN